MTILETITFILCLMGVFFMLLSSFGLLRLPDVYTRGHSAGKAGTIGVIGVLLGVGLYHADPLATAKMLALIVFFLLTSPVAAQIIERAAFVTEVEMLENDAPNDLKGRYDEHGNLR
ncbi:monovalent cation/H(+) antiporter subunit G [Candidatus Viridilinea mediisalina]|uniref:Na+/H+ antiporter subunit G n=1 Tax=Candidatus Viridilinea mediisalina TaxID=2024553 RepID=A0A2A6RKS2_9CHLR|nr:monovalent cation/H(+) antiporter subunit G [Candidatus Viridilinea mediisalina]PDW03677.1 Na+/H+ antiporter subunit G [Candidatus Viridilinea mediisalina]